MSSAMNADRAVSLPPGPPKLNNFAHVSLPCRDLEEGKLFYTSVLGGELMFSVPTYAAVRIAGIQFGLGTDGGSYIAPSMEYPHIAFYVEAGEMLEMRAWLGRCGIPVSDLWTREGREALMFFRDPSGNLIELLCRSGLAGAETLPRGNARAGKAIDIDSLSYSEWRLPSQPG